MSCKKTGGSGATGYGDYVWGKGAEQHAISSDTNVIAVVNDPAKYTGDNKVVGGYKGGYKGGDLTSVGVPVLLIAANQLYKGKRQTKGQKQTQTKRQRQRQRQRQYKNKRISRQMKGGSPDLNGMMKQSDDMMKMMMPTTIPAVVYTNSNSAAPAASNNVQVFGGGNVRQTGAGILTDIAVPAVLMTANQLYKRRSGKYNKNRNHKRSRRVTFKRMYKR
jgi:hypothetical protein